MDQLVGVTVHVLYPTICVGEESDARIENNVFLKNTALAGGGGTSFARCEVVFLNNIIEDCLAQDEGGLYCNYSARVRMQKNVVRDNVATGKYGGGVFIGSSPVTLEHCTIIGNTSGEFGGGIHCCWDSWAQILGNVIIGNRASWGAGIVFMSTTEPKIPCDAVPLFANNTVANNIASEVGGGMMLRQSSPRIVNSIFWWNEAPLDSEIHTAEFATPAIIHCNVAGGWSGEATIDTDPLLVNPDGQDYHLAEGSPCIDAGTTSVGDLSSTDFDSNPRLVDGDGDAREAVDIGAYEFTSEQ